MKNNRKNEYIKTTSSKRNTLCNVGFNVSAKLDELFPEISQMKKKETSNANTNNVNHVMNYLENTIKPTIQSIKPQVNVQKEVDLKVDDFNYFEVNFEMSKMICRWDEYTKTYKMLYGDDIYEKIHLFPNYNYDYFDILDNKYEYEQEELVISENIDTNDNIYDNYIYIKYEV